MLNPLDRVAAMLQFTGDVRLVEWVCRQAGGYFVPNPLPKKCKPQAMCCMENVLLNRLIKVMTLVVALSSADGIVPEQKKVFRAETEQVKSSLEAFAEGLERGNFRLTAHCRSVRSWQTVTVALQC